MGSSPGLFATQDSWCPRGYMNIKVETTSYYTNPDGKPQEGLSGTGSPYPITIDRMRSYNTFPRAYLQGGTTFDITYYMASSFYWLTRHIYGCISDIYILWIVSKMTFTSMIKELVLPVSGETGLEAAIVAQVATYIPNTYQIFDLSCYAESGELCVVGNIGSTATDSGYAVPFYAVNTAGQDVANPTWVVSALDYDIGVSFTLQEENAGLYSLVEIPSASTNWGKELGGRWNDRRQNR